MEKTRNYWLDNAKFVLIILVILWHCSEKFEPGLILTNSNTVMSFFRMPLFIFLSGLFSRKTEWGRFGNWLWSISETYLVFTLIQILPGILLGKTVPLRFFLEPRWTLWYLMSLCLWRSCIQLFAGVVTPKWYLFFSLLIGCLSGFLNLGPVLSLQRTLTLAPFFMIGYYCGREKVNLNAIRKIPVFVSLIVLSLLWTSCLMIKDFPLKQFLNGSEAFIYFEGYSPLFLLVLRIFAYMICVLASVCVLRLIPSKESWLSVEGRNTLYYYTFHAPIIISIVILGKVVNLPGSSLGILLYTFVVVGLIGILVKIPFFRSLPRLFTSFYELVFHNIKREM